MTNTPRIALLGFSIECNRFAPVATEADFRTRTLIGGPDLIADARSPAPAMLGELPGFLAAMDEGGAWEPVPSLLAMAEPNGPVEQAFFDRYFPRAAPQLQRLPDAEAVKLAAKYSGAYQWTRRNHSDIEKVLNLTAGLKVGALQNGNLVVSGLGQDPLQFEPIGTDLYREVLQGNMQIAFRTDAGGRVTHMFFNMLPFMPTERAPWYDQASVWFTALGVILLACLGALASAYYRWREIRALPTPERRAIWTGALTALWAIATFAVLGGVLAVTGIDSLLERIPTGLRVGLVMPLVFVVLTIYLIVTTLGVWRHRFWTVGRRIGYSVMAVAAILLCIFFWQWNLLGWRFG